MIQSAHGPKSVPFAAFDAKTVPVLRPANQLEGAITGLTVILPTTGLTLTCWQSCGAITHAGALAGKLQYSSDAGSTWVDLITFNSAGSNDFQTQRAVVPGDRVKYVGTVSGDGAGTILASSGIMY